MEIQDINLDEYRRQAAYVPQDVYLFSDTVEKQHSV